MKALEPEEGEATPRPWRISVFARKGWMQIQGANGEEIVDVNSSNGLDDPDLYPDGANAKLIVTAVNAYEANQAEIERLRDALENARRTINALLLTQAGNETLGSGFVYELYVKGHEIRDARQLSARLAALTGESLPTTTEKIEG